MTVLRRLDAVLEPTKQAVLDMKATLDKAESPTRIKPFVRRPASLLQHVQIHLAGPSRPGEPAATQG
jgi:hypothetical protein